MESETAYGSEDQVVMVGQQLWVTLQAHIVMNKFMLSKVQKNTEVYPHKTLLLFDQQATKVEVMALRYKV